MKLYRGTFVTKTVTSCADCPKRDIKTFGIKSLDVCTALLWVYPNEEGTPVISFPFTDDAWPECPLEDAPEVKNEVV